MPIVASHPCPLAIAVLVASALAAAAQTPSPSAAATPVPTGQLTLCGQPIPPPAKVPPAGSPPVVYQIVLCFDKQGGSSVIDPQTYLYYIQQRGSQPSQDNWLPYDEEAEKRIIEDHKRLWNTNFLDNLWIDATDYHFSNGVVGKLIGYHMEERQRVKIIDYVGSKKVEQSKIEEKLKEAGIQIRLDSFIDPGTVRRVQGIVRGMLSEQGYQFATVTSEIKPLAGGPKLVHLTFHLDEGPKVKIREIRFIGNKAVSSRALKRQMKANKQRWFLSFMSGRGTYQEAKFEEDADRIVEYYRNKGYIAVRVGQPELKYSGDSADKKTRWMQLRVQITEGQRYKVGDFGFDGNTVVKTDALRPLFKVKASEYYSEKEIRKGLDKAREVYGAGGYFEFTALPDLKPRDEAADGDGQATGGKSAATAPPPEASKAPPIVDVTMRVQEGKQYFINRITFVGNHTTRDNVIRREMRLYENGIFNTEALKYSVRRINQLGYFKQLEGQKDVAVEKTPDADNKVDLKVKLEEQNRNQLTFGAGVSQFEGFFGQLAFQTSNFAGRGESLTLSLQAGSRAQNFQVSFTEPFLFDRNITGGIDVFKREIRYISQFTQASAGGNIVFGFPVADFSRMYVNYSNERVRVKELNELFTDPVVLARNPFLRDSLLIGQGGVRTISKITPSFVHNTVDNPIFPNTGRRYTVAIDLAGIGGNTNFYKPRAEGVWFLQHTRRTSVGLRAEFQYINPFSGTNELPIFEKLFQGGEYSVRGFDIRSIGPSDPETGLVIGGNKSLLLNGEYLISIAGPVRLVLFYDAGQVLDRGQNFTWRDFKTSTGAEVRFFMPVLNVPFRLIFAYNPQREGVLDNNLRPQKEFNFRFAVGSTF